MIYSKLEVVLLSVIARSSRASNESVLATYILEHVKELDDVTITYLASVCHVGTGSVSRFCKMIGLQDFFELRSIIQAHNIQYHKKEKKGLASPKQIEQALLDVDCSLSEKQLAKLAKDLRFFSRIAVFGLLKGQSACLAFAQEMLACGKVVYTNLSLFEQIEYFEQAQEDDLIVIFSYTGSYFDYIDLRRLRPALKRPKIWMVTGAEKEMDVVDEWLVFKSDGSVQDHPYQLLRASEKIIQAIKETNG